MLLHYRKKPVVIETTIWTGDNITEILDFCDCCFTYNHNDEVLLKVATLEGTMNATVGDYIIKGVKGEFYPCKPHIFLLTYEEVV